MAKESYAIFIDGEKANGEADSLKGIIVLTPDAEEGAEIRRKVKGKWVVTHERRDQVWEAVDPKGETVDEFVTRQEMPDEVTKPPWEDPDPFRGLDELDDPALLYVIERWKTVDGGRNESVVVEGRIDNVVLWSKVRRGSVLPPDQGGDRYDSDEQHGQLKWTPDLKCDLIVRQPLAEILAADGDLGIVRECLRQLGGALDRTVYGLMVEHVERIYAVKDGKVQPVAQRGGVDMGKEVKPTKEKPDQGTML